MINASEVADVMRDAVGIAIRLAGPALVLSLLVGVLVAIFQAVLYAQADRGDCRTPDRRRVDAGDAAGLYQRNIRSDRRVTKEEL